ncbi:AAA family ATPase [Candidatus Woesearchaeota archaeon]|nr:AAA family ATPase [Candidatus Woesearchaeota archaeon]
MIVFLTTISETDKKTYIEETVRIAKKNGHSIKYISLGAMLMEELKSDLDATFVPKNVLNIDEEFRALAMKNLIQKLKGEVKKHKNLIISGHATFFWKKNFTNAFNWKYLRDIKPDMFITLIDNTDNIKNRMNVSEQWKEQKMTPEQILAWQNVEVNTTAGWAQLFNKPHYIIPRNESRDLLYKLMLKPETELIYVSFPMTNIKDPVTRKKIDTFIRNLEKYFAVLNPRSIELGQEFGEAEAAQTFLRDLKWFTGKANKIIVYFLPQLVFSAGVLTEINHAFETTKEVWMILPKRFYGPFEKHLISEMFYSEEEFFKFIKKKGYKELKIKI